MKRNDLIKSLIDESSSIEIPELSNEVRETPISVIPIEFKSSKSKKRFYAPLFRMMLIFVLSFGFFYNVVTKPETKVSLDINPSIEFTVNRFDKIISVKAYNDSGREFLKDLNINFCSTEEAITKIIAHAKEKGYISENSTSLLYSISSLSDSSYAFESKLKHSFALAFNKCGATGEFLSVEPSPIDQAQASRYGISPAKFAFIRELYAKRLNRECSPNEIPHEYLDDSVSDILSQLSA